MALLETMQVWSGMCPWRWMPWHGITPSISGFSLSAQDHCATAGREILKCHFESNITYLSDDSSDHHLWCVGRSWGAFSLQGRHTSGGSELFKIIF
mmetsp:Transcript_33965/g.62949  ORF Transcript_33965/g.62949 Transcript_33965/m.62949 type:complete len:96 (+) Transcript_33965:299-586(+)